MRRGHEFFIDICFVTQKQFAMSVFGAAAATAIFFLIISLLFLKSRPKIKYVIAVLLMLSTLVSGYYVSLIPLFKSEGERLHKEKQLQDQRRSFLKNAQDVISISNLKENYIYNKEGEIDYMNVSIDMASKVPFYASSRMMIGGESGLVSFKEAPLNISIQPGDKNTFIFPVKVITEKASTSKYVEMPFPVSIYFTIKSDQISNEYGFYYIAMVPGGDGWKWSMSQADFAPTYYSNLLYTQPLKLSDFAESTSSSSNIKTAK